jgi:hypothetical protein
MTLIISKGLTLDNGTRAAAIAGVSPTLDYRFAREKREIETVSLTDKLTFTGGNQGTFVGSDGFIQPATTNVPRFDHDPLSRQSLGLLSEVSRENLLRRSEEFNNASWTKIRSNIAANTAVAPNGLPVADKLVEDTTANNNHICFQAPNLSANFHAMSLYVKAAERNQLFLRLDTAAAQRNVLFDLAQASVLSESVGCQGTIKAVGNGWFYITNRLLAQENIINAVVMLASGGVASYTGDGTSGLFLWGAQLEQASTPSTYIPTTSAAVTRTADSAVIDGTGILTGTYTMVEKPADCAVVSGSNINLQPGFTAERVMVFPAALDAGQITAIRGAM